MFHLKLNNTGWFMFSDDHLSILRLNKIISAYIAVNSKYILRKKLKSINRKGPQSKKRRGPQRNDFSNTSAALSAFSAFSALK
jgi:hypothetical protein